MRGPMPAYGNDALTASVKARFAEIFEHEVAVFLVTTGTAANALALVVGRAALGTVHLPRRGACDRRRMRRTRILHARGEAQGTCRAIGGKIAPGTVSAYLDSLPKAVKQMPPKALSISQVTECGMVYSPAEIAALAAVCRKHGLFLHMDGARFANALRIPRLHACRHDLEAWSRHPVIRRDQERLPDGGSDRGVRQGLAEAMDYRAKRAGQVISKGRLIAAQLEGYFGGDHWLANARHANEMAKRLSEGLAQLPGVRLAWPTEANEVFPVVPKRVHKALQEAGARYQSWTGISLPQGERIAADEELIRLVMSFATSEGEIADFLDAARAGAERHAAE